MRKNGFHIWPRSDDREVVKGKTRLFSDREKTEGVASAEQLADRRKRCAIQRDHYPADLVGTVIFLASDDSDFMTGQAIGVDGGMNMH